MCSLCTCVRNPPDQASITFHVPMIHWRLLLKCTIEGDSGKTWASTGLTSSQVTEMLWSTNHVFESLARLQKWNCSKLLDAIKLLFEVVEPVYAPSGSMEHLILYILHNNWHFPIFYLSAIWRLWNCTLLKCAFINNCGLHIFSYLVLLLCRYLVHVLVVFLIDSHDYF